ncbi:MAG: T9SS type A sorting domain-containing protein [Bacteroidota bacterium]
MISKYLCQLLLLLHCAPLIGQDYQPMVIESNRWFYENKTWDIASGGGWIFYHDYFTIFIEGDTTLDGTAYKQLYLQKNNEERFVGGIRENLDTRRVYVYLLDPDLLNTFYAGCGAIMEQETLLYDFSVEVGDTVVSCFQGGEVFQRDTILHQGEALNRILVNIHGVIAEAYWMEGIGSIRGLFGPFTGEFENEWSLLCFSSDINPNFSGPNAEPWMIEACTGIVSLPSNQRPNIEYYPNPAQEWLALKGLFNTEAEIVIYNSLGQRVLHNREKSTERQINLSSLQAGIYHIVIYERQRMSWTDKLLILR